MIKNITNEQKTGARETENKRNMQTTKTKVFYGLQTPKLYWAYCMNQTNQINKTKKHKFSKECKIQERLWDHCIKQTNHIQDHWI